MSVVVWLTKSLNSLGTFILLVYTIPLAFDVGGRDCGLTYTLALTVFYSILSTLRLTLRRTRLGWFPFIVGVFQNFIIPSILIFILNSFTTDNSPSTWVHRVALELWDWVLTKTTPLFTLIEGFASLLVIQAIGQICRWVVNNRSDSWMIAFLVSSASTIAGSFYFLVRIWNFPSISPVDALLMGIALTSAFILCSYAIVSGRGTIPEGALLWAYVVLNIYFCTTNFVAGSANTSPAPPLPETTQPSLPPMIINTYNTLLDLLRQFLPTTIHNTLNFAYTAIIHILTPSILTSLLYRIFVLYAATRVVPAIRGVHQDLADPDFDTSEPSSKLMHVFITYSPVILIATYTNLLLSTLAPAASAGGPWTWILGVKGGWGGFRTWRWINTFATMALYTIEMQLGGDMDLEGNGEGITGHWKIE